MLKPFLKRIFTKDTFASNVATLGTGSFIGQLSTLAAAPLLARLFLPEAFGELQYILSIALILGAISTLRFEMALPLANDNSAAKHLLVLAILLALGTALIVTLVFLLDPPIIASIYSSISSKGLILFIPLILFFEAQNSIFSYWFTRTKNFKVPSLARSFSGAGTALAQTAIALGGIVSGLGLIGGYILGQISSFVWYVYMFLRTGEKIPVKSISLTGIFEQAREHKKFPLFSSWNVVLNTISRNLPPLLLVSYFSVEEAGYYAIGIRLLNMPLNTFGMSVGQVYYQQTARYKEQGIAMLPLMRSTILKLLAIIILPLLMIFFFGEQLFGFVFGESWITAGTIAAIMVPFYFMRFISSPLSSIFAVMGKQHLGLIWQLAYTLGTFASFYFTRTSNDFLLAIKVYSLVGSALFFTLLLVTMYMTRASDRRTKLKYEGSN
ncbi:MAG: oligosaccharide flippase family protein [Candidatus Marinimicrobia bacterium]|jgi:O-antigen/teichoic acid export membrane protein|nr:oligosaccharide flippase family protein [Candidatus Neomarinimicrobiota bacterium]MBT3576628.1 oligosaccharide flippase family protein [Candidatus Neomarinimicrobiota bacterium]MBT3680266.1 oligosaccharide flippase family protein [Candidatus Neomarinimicrobiota bacterium]MBT3950396.1 oligosaccharide flippase family protein [Candidatus Neomarinimicrobiota bacterium]MBT4253653.1 oligosaccharide flippase family protein [Candidatus Neomarinimicrobiota bacterium]